MSSSDNAHPAHPVVKWIDERLPVFTFVNHELRGYPTPRNLNYWWSFGSIAGIVLMLIGVTGGLMSFQEDILEWINADQVAHFENDQRLSPPDPYEK